MHINEAIAKTDMKITITLDDSEEIQFIFDGGHSYLIRGGVRYNVWLQKWKINDLAELCHFIKDIAKKHSIDQKAESK